MTGNEWSEWRQAAVVVPYVLSTRSVVASGPRTAWVGRGDTISATDAPAASIPRSQLYYWSRSWQKNERAAVRELEAGEGHRFESGVDAIRWLLSDED